MSDYADCKTTLERDGRKAADKLLGWRHQQLAETVRLLCDRIADLEHTLKRERREFEWLLLAYVNDAPGEALAKRGLL